MKKIVKVIFVFLIIFIYTFHSLNVYAIDPVTNPNTYKPVQQPGINPIVTDMGKVAFSIITSLGIIIAVIALVLIGINFIFGSPEKKSEYIQRLVPLVVGIVMLIFLIKIIAMFSNLFSS